MNLNQVTIPSLDVANSIKYYEQLGLKLLVKALPHYARFKCPTGDSTFSVHQVKQLPEGEGIVIYFECEDLDDLVGSLLSKEIEIEDMPKDQPWLWREARLKDPDNNQIILYYAGENRLNPPWRVE